MYQTSAPLTSYKLSLSRLRPATQDTGTCTARLQDANGCRQSIIYDNCKLTDRLLRWPERRPGGRAPTGQSFSFSPALSRLTTFTLHTSLHCSLYVHVYPHGSCQIFHQFADCKLSMQASTSTSALALPSMAAITVL